MANNHPRRIFVDPTTFLAIVTGSFWGISASFLELAFHFFGDGAAAAPNLLGTLFEYTFLLPARLTLTLTLVSLLLYVCGSIFVAIAIIYGAAKLSSRLLTPRD
jgi:hypothetical protein